MIRRNLELISPEYIVMFGQTSHLIIKGYDPSSGASAGPAKWSTSLLAKLWIQATLLHLRQLSYV